MTTLSQTGTVLLSLEKQGVTRMEAPTVEEIWKWTMTPDAVAPCFARDVFDMRENLEGGADFYWLGRVPCRTVRVIGMVVGLQVFESKILYSIDDGTGVIDCAYRAQRVADAMSKPVARIGLLIKVVGKVQRACGTRQIQASDIELCKSMNDEPLHWRRVRELHRTNYDLKEPFVIPPSSVTVEPIPIVEPTTPSPVASVVNSPIQVAPTKSLRHPCRLRSRDLTDNTFRIYVMHYMLNAPSVATVSINDIEAADRTAAQHTTPRPAIRQMASAAVAAHDKGFTLSYLRRVPELAEMARRVVLAKAKQQDRGRRKKRDEGRSGGSAARGSGSAAAHDLPAERTGAKMKRLFRWAIVQLLHEGSIVLWDGPVRACDAHGSETSGLWRRTVSFGSDSGISGISGGTCYVRSGTPDEALSDPERDEEGYMPVTPGLIGDYVEHVIRELCRARKEEIVARLRRDDRWRHIGEWQVQEALEHLQQESRTWRIGEKWELTMQ